MSDKTYKPAQPLVQIPRRASDLAHGRANYPEHGHERDEEGHEELLPLAQPALEDEKNLARDDLLPIEDSDAFEGEVALREVPSDIFEQVNQPACNLGRAAELFRVLGDPTRLSILALCLEEAKPVGLIADTVGISPSLTSHHLRLLKASRLVTSERDGRIVRYAASDVHVRRMVHDVLAHQSHAA